MRRLATWGCQIALAFLLGAASASAAHAYLDPGTGSIILQVVLGGAAGLVLAGRLYWQKLLSWFGFKRKSTDLQDLHQDQS